MKRYCRERKKKALSLRSAAWLSEEGRVLFSSTSGSLFSSHLPGNDELHCCLRTKMRCEPWLYTHRYLRQSTLIPRTHTSGCGQRHRAQHGRRRRLFWKSSSSSFFPLFDNNASSASSASSSASKRLMSFCYVSRYRERSWLSRERKSPQKIAPKRSKCLRYQIIKLKKKCRDWDLKHFVDKKKDLAIF